MFFSSSKKSNTLSCIPLDKILKEMVLMQKEDDKKENPPKKKLFKENNETEM